MKRLWLHFVRFYLRLGLFFYYKNIEVHGLDNVPNNKPVLILSNHQNALLDALLIATKTNRFLYFLTRAAVFKKSFVSKVLNSLQMLPVYRVRDGWKNLSNNSAIFKTCTALLSRDKAIVIFPEGSHNLARRVRPLSKGFTRIVFNTREKYPDLDLQLVPVGLNFVKPKDFGDSVALYFGNAIDAKAYASNNKDVVRLKQDIHTAISNLTTHIPLENYDEDLSKLHTLNIDFLNPLSVNKCIANKFKDCKSSPPNYYFKQIKNILKGLLILNLLIPYLIWKLVVEPKVDELEFLSTFRFVIAITLVPIYLIIVFMFFNIVFGITVATLYLFFILLLALGAVKL